MNQFYIETRYPSDSYIPVSEKEAQGLHGCCKEIDGAAGVSSDYYLTTTAKKPEALQRKASRLFLEITANLCNTHQTIVTQWFPA